MGGAGRVGADERCGNENRDSVSFRYSVPRKIVQPERRGESVLRDPADLQASPDDAAGMGSSDPDDLGGDGDSSVERVLNWPRMDANERRLNFHSRLLAFIR